MHSAHISSYPFACTPGHKLQKSSKESGIFQSLGTISFVLFYENTESKGGHGTMDLPLNALLNIALVTSLVKVALQKWMPESGVIGGKNVPY